jgi:hypothetical protein
VAQGLFEDSNSSRRLSDTCQAPTVVQMVVRKMYLAIFAVHRR